MSGGGDDDGDSDVTQAFSVLYHKHTHYMTFFFFADA